MTAGAVQPRPAATVALLRHGADAPEVLLTHRPSTMAFGPGLHVFPGGALDPGDADPSLLARTVAPARPDPGGLHGLPFAVAAIREAWEEAGVLLADGPDAGAFPPPGTPAAEGRSFGALVLERDVRLRTDLLAPLSRWVTPAALPRRYDARFFVAWLPDGALPAFDPREVAGHDWLTPAAALRAMAERRIELWMPTACTLAELEAVRTRDELAGLGPTGPARVPSVVEGAGDGTVTGVHVHAAGGVPGRRGVTTLVGRRSMVAVDPGDPSEEALAAVLGIVNARGGKLGAVALTSAEPGVAAGAEHLALQVGVPVVASAAAARRLACEVTIVAPGDLVAGGDVAVEVLPGRSGSRADALRYRVGGTRIQLG